MTIVVDVTRQRQPISVVRGENLTVSFAEPSPVEIDVSKSPVILVGTMVVAVPYNDWPPVSPQPDTLYLRLAP